MNDVAWANGGLDEVMGRIGAASRTLNGAAERATRIIEDLDERLTEADPGVSVWSEVLVAEKVPCQRENAPAEMVQRQVTLGFGRVKKKKWGLCVKEELKGKKGVTLDEEITLLRKADRNLRLLALPHLEGLAQAILSELEGRAERAESLFAPPEAESEEEALAVATSAERSPVVEEASAAS